MVRVFGRIGLLSFGGPAAQIALMHRELVEERDWLSEAQFLRALSFCMLLPGPEAMQLATFAGWRLRGVAGGLLAGLLFVIPGALVVLALALIYAHAGDVPLVQALFLGVKAVVVVIVIEALLKVAKRALKRPLHWALAGLSFVGIFLFDLPFPLIILLAGIVGFLNTEPQGEAVSVALVPVRETMRTVVVWLAIWLVPLLVLALTGGEFLTTLGLFFSKLAVVTFGGAYAVLAYMTQAVVGDFGWLSTPEMMDALGLAETTPGPLILVTEFVAVIAGFREGGLGLALLAGFVTLWVTFAPCFLWIFAGAPYIDWLSGQPRLSGALQAITAAVVGVILNLSLWFALHVFFGTLDAVRLGPMTVLVPEWRSFQIWPAALAVGAGYLLLVRHVGLVKVLGLAGLAALGLHMLSL